MFNKFHYRFIAKALKDSKPTGVLDLPVWERTVRTVAHDLKSDNEHFSYPTFYNACGLQWGKSSPRKQGAK